MKSTMLMKLVMFQVLALTLTGLSTYYLSYKTVVPQDNKQQINVENWPSLIGNQGCNRTYTYIFDPVFGFGSEFSNFVMCVAYAIHTNRTLIIQVISNILL